MHQTSSLSRTSKWRKIGPKAWSKGVFCRDDLNLSIRKETVTLEEPKNIINSTSPKFFHANAVIDFDEIGTEGSLVSSEEIASLNLQIVEMKKTLVSKDIRIKSLEKNQMTTKQRAIMEKQKIEIGELKKTKETMTSNFLSAKQEANGFFRSLLDTGNAIDDFKKKMVVSAAESREREASLEYQLETLKKETALSATESAALKEEMASGVIESQERESILNRELEVIKKELTSSVSESKERELNLEHELKMLKMEMTSNASKWKEREDSLEHRLDALNKENSSTFSNKWKEQKDCLELQLVALKSTVDESKEREQNLELLLKASRCDELKALGDKESLELILMSSRANALSEKEKLELIVKTSRDSETKTLKENRSLNLILKQSRDNENSTLCDKQALERANKSLWVILVIGVLINALVIVVIFHCAKFY